MPKVNFPNYLDEIRVSRSKENLLKAFDKMAVNDVHRTLNLLNDKNLTFSSFFLLRPSIEKYNLYDKLNLRNKATYNITGEMLTKKKSLSTLQYLFSDYLKIVHSSIKWMIETGYLDSGISDDFDEVIDIASIILTRTYRDKTVLPYIADIIFSRHSKDLLVHDLVWAFFEAKAPESLILIVSRLRSLNKKDIELAQKLLCFCPFINPSVRDYDRQYFSFMEWLEENGPFLYYKGESLQQHNNPRLYTVMLEGKYLHNPVLPETGTMLNQLSKHEMDLLNEFIRLDAAAKITLADYSSRLYRKDKILWNRWLSLPVVEQIKASKGGIL